MPHKIADGAAEWRLADIPEAAMADKQRRGLDILSGVLTANIRPPVHRRFAPR